MNQQINFFVLPFQKTMIVSKVSSVSIYRLILFLALLSSWQISFAATQNDYELYLKSISTKGSFNTAIEFSKKLYELETQYHQDPSKYKRGRTRGPNRTEFYIASIDEVRQELVTDYYLKQAIGPARDFVTDKLGGNLAAYIVENGLRMLNTDSNSVSLFPSINTKQTAADLSNLYNLYKNNPEASGVLKEVLDDLGLLNPDSDLSGSVEYNVAKTYQQVIDNGSVLAENKSLSEKYYKLLKKIYEVKKSDASEVEKARRIKELQYNIRELSGAAYIFGSILRYTGNPEDGATIIATSQLIESIGVFALDSTLGPFAVTAGVVSAVGIFASALGKQAESADTKMLKLLLYILQEMRQEIAAGFEGVHGHLNLMWADLIEHVNLLSSQLSKLERANAVQFQLIIGSLAETQRKIEKLNDSLLTTNSSLNKGLQEIIKAPLDASIDEILLLEPNEITDKEFKQLISRLGTFGSKTIATNPFNADFIKQISIEQMADLIDVRKIRTNETASNTVFSVVAYERESLLADRKHRSLPNLDGWLWVAANYLTVMEKRWESHGRKIEPKYTERLITPAQDLLSYVNPEKKRSMYKKDLFLEALIVKYLDSASNFLRNSQEQQKIINQNYFENIDLSGNFDDGLNELQNWPYSRPGGLGLNGCERESMEQRKMPSSEYLSQNKWYKKARDEYESTTLKFPSIPIKDFLRPELVLAERLNLISIDWCLGLINGRYRTRIDDVPTKPKARDFLILNAHIGENSLYWGSIDITNFKNEWMKTNPKLGFNGSTFRPLNSIRREWNSQKEGGLSNLFALNASELTANDAQIGHMKAEILWRKLNGSPNKLGYYEMRFEFMLKRLEKTCYINPENVSKPPPKECVFWDKERVTPYDRTQVPEGDSDVFLPSTNPWIYGVKDNMDFYNSTNPKSGTVSKTFRPWQRHQLIKDILPPLKVKFQAEKSRVADLLIKDIESGVLSESAARLDYYRNLVQTYLSFFYPDSLGKSSIYKKVFKKGGFAGSTEFADLIASQLIVNGQDIENWYISAFIMYLDSANRVKSALSEITTGPSLPLHEYLLASLKELKIRQLGTSN